VFYNSWKEYLQQSDKRNDEPLVMPWLFSKPYRRHHPEKVRDIKERYTKGYLSRNSKSFERQLQANTTHDSRRVINGIDIPTLILAGKDDELTPPRMAKELEAEIPLARLVLFDQGGHGLYWEVPQLFNEAVLDFLESNTP
jgi:pimeloyl-ACP methyl ester carboxylesterase